MLKLDSRGEDVRTLQENLTTLGYRPGKADGVFGEKTEDAVVEFQEEVGILPDGVVGSNTQEALEKAIRDHILEQQSPGSSSMDGDDERLRFVRVPADKYKNGFDRFFLRSDVAEAYNRVREKVLEAGGKVTSSGGRRRLDVHVSPSRSATSFHYTGRALDLNIKSGMEAPSRDPYVVVAEPNRYWRVYARAEGGEEMELDAITYGNRKRPRKVSGKFIDLTALFKAEGFERIRAHKPFFRGGSAMHAEWWHFQCETGLVPKVSKFGDELLRVYSKRELRDAPPWKFRDRVFKVNWF